MPEKITAVDILSAKSDDATGSRFHKVFTVAPDTLSEPVIREIIASVEQALSEGFKRIVLSIINGSLGNKIAVSRHLLHCQQTVRQKGGRLYVIEHSTSQYSEYLTICSTMNVPIYFDD